MTDEPTTCQACGSLKHYGNGTHKERSAVGESEAPRCGSPAECYAFLKRRFKGARQERLVVVYLDAQNHVLSIETVSLGSLNTTRTLPREIFAPALRHSAMAIIIAHNHPSGSLEPSRDDVEFTRNIARGGDIMGVTLFDHLIVARSGYVSLKERGLM